MDDDTLGLDDPFGTFDELPLATTVGSLAPGIAGRSGLIPGETVPSGIRRPVLTFAPTWELLAAASVGEMLAWPGVGQLKVARIVAFARAMAGVTPAPAVERDDATQVLDGVRLIAAWAVAQGLEVGLPQALLLALGENAPDEIKSAAAALEDLDLRVAARARDLARFDPVAAGRQLLEAFDGRDLEILERVLAKGLRPVRTLEELGHRFQVTRERVRQLEVQVRQRLAQLLALPEYGIVQAHADRLAERIGRARPITELPPELVPTVDGDLIDELFAFLAGPFTLVGEWFLTTDLPTDLNAIVARSYLSTGALHSAPLDSVVDALAAEGIHADVAGDLISKADRFRVLDDQVVRWSTISDRLAGVLAAAARPLSFEQLCVAIELGAVGNLNGVRNVLTQSLLFKRVGKHEWALADWDGDEYLSIAEHMVEALKSGPRSTAELSAELADRFGISPNSVVMYATMHPMFVTSQGVVRTRRGDEPFVPVTSLELSNSCFVVDGAWALSIPIDRDILRGSGRSLPDAFATHLGLWPGSQGTLATRERAIRVGWPGMRPAIGSLRAVAEDADLVTGDRLFIRRATPSELEFRFIRNDELRRLQTVEQLMALVGASNFGVPIERWLGDALGLGGATMPSRSQLRARLVVRGEDRLLELFEEICAEGLAQNSVATGPLIHQR